MCRFEKDRSGHPTRSRARGQKKTPASLQLKVPSGKVPIKLAEEDFPPAQLGDQLPGEFSRENARVPLTSIFILGGGQRCLTRTVFLWGRQIDL